MPTGESGMLIEGNWNQCAGLYGVSWRDITKARFRCIPGTGQSSFMMMSLHCDNAVDKTRSTEQEATITSNFVLELELISVIRYRTAVSQRLIWMYTARLCSARN